MTELASRVRRALPSSLARRVRWLFATFAVLVTGLFAVPLVVSDAALWPGRLAGLTALAAIAAWAWLQYRQNGLSPLWDAVPILAILVAVASTGTGGAVIGPMIAILFGRALYDSAGRVWANAAAYLLAYEAGRAATSGLASVVDLSLLTTGVSVLIVTATMWILGDVIRAHERETRRGSVLARAASELQRARSHDEVYEAGVAAGLELIGDEADGVVAWWRGDTDMLRLEGRAGAVPEDVPPQFPMAVLPADLRETVLRGEPFEMDEQTTIATQQAMGIEDLRLTSCLVVPLEHGQSFGGLLTAASSRPLDPELIASLERLAADVGLALELADNTLLLRQVVDNSSDAILLVDGELTVDFVSPAIGSVLGYDPGEILGRRLTDLLEADDTDLREVLDRAARASARRDPHVFSMRHRDGSNRQIELATTPLPEGRRRGWVTNLRDVTRRIEAEQELDGSRQRFRALAESVSEGLYQVTLHPEPRFEYVNPAMEEMTGFDARQFMDDPTLTLGQVHPDDLDLVRRTRSAPHTVEWPMEVRWSHPTDGWRWLLLRETVIHDADGTPVSTMGVISDVTARKQQEESLHRALENERRVIDALRRVDAMRTTFLQAVSHELRTPLTTIVGFSQTLNRAGNRLDEAKRATMLERLESNAEKLDRLLSDLLDVDRLSSGIIEPARRPVDVTELCRRVVAQTPTPTHPVTCSTTSVVTDIDPSKVERIVVNLLGNAVKHTAPGTPIDIGVTPPPGVDGVLITVEDRGTGIPEDLRETIFEAFVQGPESSRSPQPGTGIGLSLVARFAELHGGRAWLEQREGGGSRFCVLLPAGAPPEADQDTEEPVDGHDRSLSGPRP